MEADKRRSARCAALHRAYVLLALLAVSPSVWAQCPEGWLARAEKLHPKRELASDWARCKTLPDDPRRMVVVLPLIDPSDLHPGDDARTYDVDVVVMDT